jgi:hypothetical protein
VHRRSFKPIHARGREVREREREREWSLVEWWVEREDEKIRQEGLVVGAAFM